MEKIREEHFGDWEGHVFGYGYGTGESHTLAALKAFMELVPESGGYNYQALEQTMTPTVAWLMINILCRAHILEYGGSPRYAWLTAQGKLLRDWVTSHTVDELYEFTQRTEDYSPCYPDACNCGPRGYEKGRKCNNPFW